MRKTRIAFGLLCACGGASAVLADESIPINIDYTILMSVGDSVTDGDTGHVEIEELLPPILGPDGTVLIAARFDGPNQPHGIWRAKPGQALEAIALDGALVGSPVLTGPWEYSVVQEGWPATAGLDADGDLAIRVSVKLPGVTDDQIILTDAGRPGLEVVATGQTGDISLTFEGSRKPGLVMNDDGDIAFVADSSSEQENIPFFLPAGGTVSAASPSLFGGAIPAGSRFPPRSTETFQLSLNNANDLASIVESTTTACGNPENDDKIWALQQSGAPLSLSMLDTFGQATSSNFRVNSDAIYGSISDSLSGVGFPRSVVRIDVETPNSPFRVYEFDPTDPSVCPLMVCERDDPCVDPALATLLFEAGDTLPGAGTVDLVEILAVTKGAAINARGDILVHGVDLDVPSGPNASVFRRSDGVWDVLNGDEQDYPVPSPFGLPPVVGTWEPDSWAQDLTSFGDSLVVDADGTAFNGLWVRMRHGPFVRVSGYNKSITATKNGVTVSRVLSGTSPAIPVDGSTNSTEDGNTANLRLMSDIGCGIPIRRVAFIGGSNANGNEIMVADIQLNYADIAAPFGVVDGADTDAFVTAFLAGDEVADLVEPYGIYDLDDIDAFVDMVALCATP